MMIALRHRFVGSFLASVLVALAAACSASGAGSSGTSCDADPACSSPPEEGPVAPHVDDASILKL